MVAMERAWIEGLRTAWQSSAPLTVVRVSKDARRRAVILSEPASQPVLEEILL